VALKKLTLKAGVNRENTRYTNENGWYESQWVRFRQGTPEKIGGYVPFVNREGYFGTPIAGIIRGMLTYAPSYLLEAYANSTFVPTQVFVGTNRGAYDFTRTTETTASGGPVQIIYPLLVGPFGPPSGTVDYYVKDAKFDLYGPGPTYTEAEITFDGSTISPVPRSVFYPGQVIRLLPPLFTPGFPSPANGNFNSLYTITSVGIGSTTNIRVSITPPPLPVTTTSWRTGIMVYFDAKPDIPTTLGEITLWSQSLFGDLVMSNRRGGPIYAGGQSLNALDQSNGIPSPNPPASAPPITANYVLVSDVSRFVFALGTQPYYPTSNVFPFTVIFPADPLLIRWCDQENYSEWAPAATNQAGELRLSKGSEIVTALQARQEVLVWTDTALYALQYLGPPVVWGAQLMGDNITIISQNAAVYANGTAYWMGDGKFYIYRGTVETLRCDLRRYVFEDLDPANAWQVTAGTNEQFNEVWWYYVSKGSSTLQPDKYVVYNYAEDIWYYGTDSASTYLDSRLGNATGPLKAVATPGSGPSPEATSVIYETEFGNDARNYPLDPVPVAAIPAYITSAEFDLDDGHQFMFAWRMLPDITFTGSDNPDPLATPPIPTPSVQMALLPMKNSGSGVTNPASVGGSNSATVLRIAPETTYTIEEFTGQVFTRIRARQIMIKISSNTLGVSWQIGSPRLDMRTDGRR
jgi:hypothetical protein